jgi:hypothetical protein
MSMGRMDIGRAESATAVDLVPASCQNEYQDRAAVTTRMPSTTVRPGYVLEIDIGSVVKVAQAVSSEIVLDKLIEKLMAITVEHARAERGFLILLLGDEPQIQAVTFR